MTCRRLLYSACGSSSSRSLGRSRLLVKKLIVFQSLLLFRPAALEWDCSCCIAMIATMRLTQIMCYYIDYKLCAANLVGPTAFAGARRAQIADPSGDVWVRLAGFTLDF